MKYLNESKYFYSRCIFEIIFFQEKSWISDLYDYSVLKPEMKYLIFQILHFRFDRFVNDETHFCRQYIILCKGKQLAVVVGLKKKKKFTIAPTACSHQSNAGVWVIRLGKNFVVTQGIFYIFFHEKAFFLSQSIRNWPNLINLNEFQFFTWIPI